MQEAKLGMMLETFLLSTGTPRHSPPIPASSPVQAVVHRSLMASLTTAPLFLSRVETAIPLMLRSKDTAKPRTNQRLLNALLCWSQRLRLNFLLHIWPLW